MAEQGPNGGENGKLHPAAPCSVCGQLAELPVVVDGQAYCRKHRPRGKRGRSVRAAINLGLRLTKSRRLLVLVVSVDDLRGCIKVPFTPDEARAFAAAMVELAEDAEGKGADGN